MLRKFFSILLSVLLVVGTVNPLFAGSLSITGWSTGDALNSVNLNSRMTSITTWANGNISDTNISGTAAIAGSKLDLTSSTGRISHSTSVTSDAPVFTSGQTWDNVANVFSLWRGTVTNTNSASTSRLIDLRVGSTIIASISRVGQLMLTPQAYASGPSTLLEGAWFNIASATYTDNMTAASGTAPRFVAYAFARPAVAAANSSVTTTDAATVFIASAPVTSTNMTLTNRYALWVDQGDVRLGGNVFASGTTTMSGNLLMSGNNAIVPAPVSGTPAQNGFYRESMAKVWASVTVTPTLSEGFNVTSVADGGTGLITFTFDRDFANSTYAVLITQSSSAVGFNSTSSKAVGSVTVRTYDSTGSASDQAFDIVIFGDQ